MSHENDLKKQNVFKEEEDTKNQSDFSESKSSSGLEQNIAGLLCYLCGFITGIVFLLIEKENSFVRFHAMQSTITFASLLILSFILPFIPLLGWILSLLIIPLNLILWVLLMYKSYKGEWFKLPIVGDIAEQQMNKYPRE